MILETLIYCSSFKEGKYTVLPKNTNEIEIA